MEWLEFSNKYWIAFWYETFKYWNTKIYIDLFVDRSWFQIMIRLRSIQNRGNIKRKGKRSYSVLWQNPLQPQKDPKSNVTTQKRHKKFDYTTIVNWLRTVSWSNNSHPTGVVKSVYERSTFPLNETALLSNAQTTIPRNFATIAIINLFLVYFHFYWQRMESKL